MGQHNIIELNGKQYDALTGALLGESKIAAMPSTKTAHLKRQGRNMDGFIQGNRPANNLKPVIVRPAEPHQYTQHGAVARVPALTQPIAAPKAAMQDKSRVTAKATGNVTKTTGQRSAQALARHQPEKPKTLMRHVVKKPSTKMKPAIKTTAPAEMMARPTSTLAKPLEKKLSVAQVSPARLSRAKHVPKSHHIRRFSENRSQQQLAAAPAASAARPGQHAAQPARQDLRPTADAVQARAQATVYAQKQPVATKTASAPDIFEAALAHATSHEQKSPVIAKRHRARRRRFINVLAGLGAFLVIAGFIAYLNKPAIELRVASIRAGFHAQMPSYKPTGYALEGGIQSSSGKVAMQFRSGEHTYQITQEASDWNSSTLLDQAAEKRGAPTRTIQSKGRTIYIYNDTAATWVNGGVHYEITGNASFDAGELVSLATSM